MEELELTRTESSATYNQIQEYVKQTFGLSVSHLYIAQVKQQHGCQMRENFNPPRGGKHQKLECPAPKRHAIEQALQHFKIL